MNKHTLKIYRKQMKNSGKIYAYFFIKREFQQDFANLESFSLSCDDKTIYHNIKTYISGDYKNPRYFIFANDFFVDHIALTKKGKDIIYYEIEGNVVKITIPTDCHIDPSKQTKSLNAAPTNNVNINSEKSIKDIELKQVEYGQAFKYKLFELIGENDNQGLRNTFKENEWCFRASEENVRAEIIDPILKALGWSVPYLRREDHKMDYVLCRDKYVSKYSTQLIIEAKKYREQLIDFDKENDTLMNEQLSDYLVRSEIQFGILTNGIRWCLFQKKKYLGEINIFKSDDVSICKFFKLISFDFIKDNEICDYELNFLDNKNEDYKPSIIVIQDKDTPSQCDACYQIATMGLEIKPEEIFDIKFYREIVFKKTDQDYDIKACRLHKPYGNSVDKFLIGDYGIYDKLTLLQEINSTLGLGLTIKAR